jgi:hypothetical protein
MSTSTTATTITKLNEHNYRAWVLDMQDVLKQLGLWRIVMGTERVPIPPSRSPTIAQAANRTVKHPPPDLQTWDFKPESDDETYLQKYETFMFEYDKYDEKRTKACGTICHALEPSIRQRYRASKYDDPRVLWETIKSDFEKVIKLDGQHEQAKLAACKLEDFPSVTEWIAAQDKIINDLAICGIEVTDNWRSFYLMSNLPTSPEWLGFTTSMNVSGKAKDPSEIITELLAFEARLRRQKGLSPEAALFVTRKQRNQARQGNGTQDRTRSYQNGNNERSRNRSGKDKKQKQCYGCGLVGHSKSECRHLEKWEAYAKQQAAEHMKNRDNEVATAQANLAAVDAADAPTSPAATPSDNASHKESFLFAAFDDKPYDSVDALRAYSDFSFTSSDWILDTGASSHITGNRELFSSYEAYAPGEHLVRTTSNQVVSASGVGTVPIRLGNTTIILAGVLYVPGCENVLSIRFRCL